MSWRRLASLAGAALFVGACANILGVSGYEDAAAVFCGPCDDPETVLRDCTDRLTDALDAASDEERAAWLKEYDRLHCDQADCATDALRCFFTAPGLCVGAGATCERSEECCGFDFDSPGDGFGCCAKDELSAAGQCCESCETCPGALAIYAAGGTVTYPQVCLSHLTAWRDLRTCAVEKCSDACMGDKDLCQACLGSDCTTPFQACGAHQGS